MRIAILYAAICLTGAAILSPSPTAADVCQPYCSPAVQVLTPAVVPLYGTGYTGGANLETNQLLLELLAEIKGLRSEVQALRAPGEAMKARDAVTILRANCASCHSGAKAKAELALFTDKGETISLQPATRREIVKRVNAGTMPPTPHEKLSQADRDAIAKAFASPPSKEVLTIPPGK